MSSMHHVHGPNRMADNLSRFMQLWSIYILNLKSKSSNSELKSPSSRISNSELKSPNPGIPNLELKSPNSGIPNSELESLNSGISNSELRQQFCSRVEIFNVFFAKRHQPAHHTSY